MGAAAHVVIIDADLSVTSPRWLAALREALREVWPFGPSKIRPARPLL